MTRSSVQPIYPTTAGAETLGLVPLPGGGRAEMLRESGPEGGVYVHPKRLDHSAALTLYRKRSIPAEGLHAAERFRSDFERGHLEGHWGSTDPLKSGGGSGGLELSEAAAASRLRVDRALAAIGGAGSYSGQVVWWCCGVGLTVAATAGRLRAAGRLVSEHRASGLLIGALERLAVFYCLASPAVIQEAAAERLRREGAEAVAAFLDLHAKGLEAAAPRDAVRHAARLIREVFARASPLAPR